MSDQNDGSGQGATLAGIIEEHRTRFIILGIVLIVIGVITIAFPLMSSIAVKIFIGWMFIIGGIAEIVHAFSARGWGGFLWSVLVGVLYGIVGIWLAFFPLAGLIGLTVLIALMFIAEGLIKVVLGFGLDRGEGRFWVILSGLVAMVLGIMLFSGLPSTAAWAIGLLVGVNFLMSGWTFLVTAIATPRVG